MSILKYALVTLLLGCATPAYAFHPHLFGGGAVGGSYQGPCDVITGGCAEAYSITRAMTSAYSGPLFQLWNGTSTLNVGQTSGRKADMTTWSAFCGGTNTTANGITTNSVCLISRIYAQIQGTPNDLVPSVFHGNANPVNCAVGGPYVCATQFRFEVATGLPITNTLFYGSTPNPGIYTLSGDAAATGIPAWNSPNAIRTVPLSLMYNGQSVPTTAYCCGTFGLTHAYTASDTLGTDFMIALAYGGNGLPNVTCSTGSTYCVGSEDESINDLVDYGSSPIGNAIVTDIYSYNSGSPFVSSYLNDVLEFTHSPPTITTEDGGFLNPGTSIHFGGGGDLSVTAQAIAREWLITTTAMSPTDEAAAYSNMTTFYSALTFPAP